MRRLVLCVLGIIVAIIGIIVGIVRTDPYLLAGCIGLLAITLVGESFC